MSEQISQRDLRNHAGRIVHALEQGTSFVVSRRGVPVGELTPLRRTRFVSREAVVAAFAGAPAVDAQRLRSDLDDVVCHEI